MRLIKEGNVVKIKKLPRIRLGEKYPKPKDHNTDHKTNAILYFHKSYAYAEPNLLVMGNIGLFKYKHACQE